MKRKKYLACCLAMSMMLASASPMAVSAEAQTDLFFSEESELEEAPVSENSEVMQSELSDSEGDGFVSEETDGMELFESESDGGAASGNENNNPNEGWTSLAKKGKEARILYKYNDDEKTLYFKCISTENVTMPDYKYAQRTDWFMDLGADKIAELKKIVIGNGITGIGKFSFQTNTSGSSYSSLEEVELADTVTSIGQGAFGADSSLKNINLNKVSSVGMAAFADCGLEQVVFDSASVNIDTNAFSGCSTLSSVKAKEINELGEGAFEDCKTLNSFEYEGTIKNISKKAFAKTALTTFRFGGVESIGFMAFWNSALKSGCYEGTREAWNNLISDDANDYSEVLIHCKGDAAKPKPATCEEDGLKAVGTCEVCGEEYSYADEENKLPALGHDYSDTYTVDKAATCTENGEQSKHCTREGCDSKTDVQEIPATGHTWTEDYVTDKAATCTEAGEKSKHCTICGAKEDVQKIPALGHDYTSKVVKDATCTEKGSLEKTCTRCGDVVKEEIPALGHDYAKTYTVDKKATCTEDGEQSRHCTRTGCDARTDVQAVKAAGHKFGEWKKRQMPPFFHRSSRRGSAKPAGKRKPIQKVPH